MHQMPNDYIVVDFEYHHINANGSERPLATLQLVRYPGWSQRIVVGPEPHMLNVLSHGVVRFVAKAPYGAFQSESELHGGWHRAFGPPSEPSHSGSLITAFSYTGDNKRATVCQHTAYHGFVYGKVRAYWEAPHPWEVGSRVRLLLLKARLWKPPAPAKSLSHPGSSNERFRCDANNDDANNEDADNDAANRDDAGNNDEGEWVLLDTPSQATGTCLCASCVGANRLTE